MNREQALLAQHEGAPRQVVCGRCGENCVETRMVDDAFQYGIGSEAVQLRVEVPLRTCTRCEF